MASVALDPAYRRTTVDEFPAMDLGYAKAELDDGLIYMMAGGTEAHARIVGNVQTVSRLRLRGSGCRTYGSDLAVRTAQMTIRFPDMSVYCGLVSTAELRVSQLLGDPRVVVEVLSSSTGMHDQKTKREEYRGCAGIADIVFVDPESAGICIVSRTARGGWTDEWLDAGADLAIPSLDLTITHADIFASDRTHSLNA